MKIGIISDTHDNVWRIDDAIPYLRSTDLVLHCGDLISPFMIHRLGKGLGNIPIHLVWGNNDGDRFTVAKIAQSYPNFTLHGEFMQLEENGFRIAMIHYPEIARQLVLSENFDLVCYGHDHTAIQETLGETVLLNPGEIMGMNGRSTLALFETETHRAELIEIWKEKN